MNKSINRFSACAAAALLVAACNEGSSVITELETPTGPMSASAKAALIGTTAPQRVGNLEANGPQLGHPAPVVYEGTLTNGHPAGAGNAVYQGRLESANWDYWQFCATAGSTVVLETHRT